MDTKKIAIITGASSGIGKGFATKLASKGYSLIITARREQRLLDLAKNLELKHQVKVTYLPLDLTKKEHRDRLFEETEGKNIHIDLLINNAGFGYTGSFSKESRENILQMIDLNVVAVADLTHLFLKKMIERKQGEIVIVSSIASFQPIPYFSLYTATKTFERSFAQSIYQEVKKHNVHILTLCPGKTDTEFSEEALLDKKKFTKGSMPIDDVVSGCLKALSRKKWLYIPGIKNRILVYSQTVFPKKLVAKIAGKLLKQDMK